jgi:hypothetical protein
MVIGDLGHPSGVAVNYAVEELNPEVVSVTIHRLPTEDLYARDQTMNLCLATLRLVQVCKNTGHRCYLLVENCGVMQN